MKMATASTRNRDSNVDLDSLTCPICLEIYEKPASIQCGHIFCTRCLTQFTGVAEPQCPMCRIQFDPSKKQRVHALDKRISSTKAACQGCSKRMTLAKLRSHNSTCSKLKTNHMTFKPVAETSQPMPRTVPNRSTFTCPICGQKNLDTHGLVKHCIEKHKNTGAQVVCPVCATMPWGDPAQKSGNFISHLNLRHRFEYDTFVDYQQDDDSMLQAALKASLEHM